MLKRTWFPVPPILAALLIAASLQGCASMQVPKPQTPTEAYYVVEKSYTGVLSIFTDLAAAGRVPKAEYERVKPDLDKIDQALDLAWSLIKQGKPAQDTLDTVQQMVAVLRAYVDSVKGAPGGGK